MPEQRGAVYHRQRVVEALRDEIGTMIEGELTDKRIGLCYITELLMAPGGKAARIYVNAQGTEEEAEQTITALNAARNYIRHQVRERLGKRHVPELAFQLDRSQQYGGRIDELLTRVEKRSRRKSEKG
jgi:ribosome-binding factor A